MKTIFIWDECEGEIKFFVLEGDHSRFNRIYINSSTCSQSLQDALCALIYDADGNYRDTIDFLPDFPSDEDTYGAYVIVCGFIS